MNERLVEANVSLEAKNAQLQQQEKEKKKTRLDQLLRNKGEEDHWKKKYCETQLELNKEIEFRQSLEE